MTASYYDMAILVTFKIMLNPVLRRLICLQALTTAHFEVIGQRHNPPS
jgi:hypothetical protein